MLGADLSSTLDFFLHLWGVVSLGPAAAWGLHRYLDYHRPLGAMCLALEADIQENPDKWEVPYAQEYEGRIGGIRRTDGSVIINGHWTYNAIMKGLQGASVNNVRISKRWFRRLMDAKRGTSSLTQMKKVVAALEPAQTPLQIEGRKAYDLRIAS